MKNTILLVVFILAVKQSSAIGYSGLNDDLIWVYALFIALCALVYAGLMGVQKIKARFSSTKNQSA